MKKIDIKSIISDKKNSIIIGSVFLNVILLCVVLYPMIFSCKRGYINEWYGSNKVVERSILKSHINRVNNLQHSIRNVLTGDNVDMDALKMVFKDLADERMKFNTIIENDMIEKFSTMSKRKRESFVNKMFMKGEKSKVKHSKSENHGKAKKPLMKIKDKQMKKDTHMNKIKRATKKVSKKIAKSMN